MSGPVIDKRSEHKTTWWSMSGCGGGGVVWSVNDSCMCVSSGWTVPISHRSHRDPCHSPRLFPVLSLSLFRPRRTRTLSPKRERLITGKKRISFFAVQPPHPPNLPAPPCVCQFSPFHRYHNLPAFPLPTPPPFNFFFVYLTFLLHSPSLFSPPLSQIYKNTMPRVLHPQIPGSSLRGGY